MIDAVPSRTALSVARRRAVHQILDRPLVFDDPLALRIVGIGADDAEAVAHDEREQNIPSRFLRASIAARSRLAEDNVALAMTRGARQYVVLGAGLDTFAYRNPFADVIRVFEVDFPATQAWKRERLAATGIVIPESVTFVPVDFERQAPFDRLRANGFDASVPTFFSWLGVTMYLSDETVFSVLHTVAALPPGSGIVFDYAVDPGCLSPIARRIFDKFAMRVASIGEPWTLQFDPLGLTERVRAAGFADVEELGPDEINRRFFGGRIDGLQVGTIMRLMKAVV